MDSSSDIIDVELNKSHSRKAGGVERQRYIVSILIILFAVCFLAVLIFVFPFFGIPVVVISLIIIIIQLKLEKVISQTQESTNKFSQFSGDNHINIDLSGVNFDGEIIRKDNFSCTYGFTDDGTEVSLWVNDNVLSESLIMKVRLSEPYESVDIFFS